MRSLISAAVLVLALTGCGGGSDSSGGGGGVKSAADVAASLDCTGFADDNSDEIYIAESGDCKTADGPLRVVYFDSTGTRDSWLDAAESFGRLDNLQKGDQWVAYTP